MYTAKLHYDTPAKDWNEALPIGNGRLGCMVYGRTETELLCLNEDSVWYGGPQDRCPIEAHKHLAELRALVKKGRHEEAERLVRRAFFASPWSQRQYEPLGNVYLEFEHDSGSVKNYKRSLDLESSVAHVEYDYKDVHVERDMIASYPDDVLALHIKSSEPIEFAIRMSRTTDREFETLEFLDSIEVKEQRMVMFVTPGGYNSQRLCCALGANLIGEGTVTAMSNTLLVNAREAIILISARTNFRHSHFDRLALADLKEAFAYPQHELWQRHYMDYMSLYDRMSISLGPSLPADAHSTDQRLLKSATPSLVTLYTNYARYLLISCSRSSHTLSLQRLDLPANLQGISFFFLCKWRVTDQCIGIWNNSFTPAWGARPTININTQMNYWPCGPCNLPLLEMPLFSLLERMAQRGTKTARQMYNCSGWCAHNNTDLYADTDIAERWMPGTLWPLGGAWLCLHIYEHYLFTLDRDMLIRMFPIMQGSVEFLLDWLIEDEENGYLTTNPSLSPENSFIDSSGRTSVFCQGSTMDIAIISLLFRSYLAATEELYDGTRLPSPSSDGLLGRVRTSLSRLPPIPISAQSDMILEWGTGFEPQEAEPGHRHTSHLFALFPGHDISPITTPKLAEAARKVLDRRATHGGGHTGWSRAWLICMWARLHDAQKVAEHVEHLLAATSEGGSTLKNLFDSHPPMQIDGNFGGSAGVVEAIVQSHEVESMDGKPGIGRRIIRLLPACPWSEGSVRGVGLRGGWTLAFGWCQGQVMGTVELDAIATADERAEAVRKLVVVYPNGKQVEVSGRARHRIAA